MIHYDLRCDRGHAFDSWFRDSAAYDSQVKRKLVSCPSCGSVKIEKAIMAPKVARSRKAATPGPAVAPEADSKSQTMLLAKEVELRAKLRELRDHVLKTADNVGERFPEEARKMHYGDAEHRPIYGEASNAEAKALIDEGIEVAPIPVLPDDHN